MIEISFTRLENINHVVPEYAEIDTVGSYIFDELGINTQDVLELDQNSDRTKKQILLRDGLDLDKYLNKFPDTFNGYHVYIEKLYQTRTRVLLRNVPIECPDAEIYNLCDAYSECPNKK